MNEFTPVRNIEHSQLVLDHGLWPDFKEADIYNLVFQKNDHAPNIGTPKDNIDIEISFELHDLEQPYIVVLKFDDCDSIIMSELDHKTALCDLTFAYKARGTDIEGDPLPRGIAVHFDEAFGKSLTFNCLKVQALERRLKYNDKNIH